MSGNKNNVLEQNPDVGEDSAEGGRPTRNRTQTNHYCYPSSWANFNITGVTDNGEETEHKNPEVLTNQISLDPQIRLGERPDTPTSELGASLVGLVRTS